MIKSYKWTRFFEISVDKDVFVSITLYSIKHTDMGVLPHLTPLHSGSSLSSTLFLSFFFSNMAPTCLSRSNTITQGLKHRFFFLLFWIGLCPKSGTTLSLFFFFFYFFPLLSLFPICILKVRNNLLICDANRC